VHGLTSTELMLVSGLLAGLAVLARNQSVVGRASARTPGLPLGLRIRARRPPPISPLLSAFSAELRAGQPIAAAFLSACEGVAPCPCPEARIAAAGAGDIPSALRRDSQARGSAGLRALAACLEVAQHSGVGLAEAVERLAEGQRTASLSIVQVRAEVAAARASSHILAALPLVGLLLGQSLGARPLAWLIGDVLGRMALVAGVSLQGLGLWWLHRMTNKASLRLMP
jgi:tight adherence protein B